MANYVKNVIKFKNLKPGDVDFILNTIATEVEGATYPGNYVIDFNKIIPEPQDESECPEDCKVNKDSHCEEIPDRPWFDWYTWRIKYWGTKWGAYDCYTTIGKSWIAFVFTTAWSHPFPISDRLKLLGFDMEVRFADECLGSNCGRRTYSREQGWHETFDEEMPNSYQFAKNVWNRF